jgi:hypothetical protein
MQVHAWHPILEVCKGIQRSKTHGEREWFDAKVGSKGLFPNLVPTIFCIHKYAGMYIASNPRST